MADYEIQFVEENPITVDVSSSTEVSVDFTETVIEVEFLGGEAAVASSIAAAQLSATNAAASATAASTSASDAAATLVSVQALETNFNDIGTTANTAIAAKDEAVTKAGEAAASAAAALTSKNSAAVHDSSAASAAGGAATSATNASTSASNAAISASAAESAKIAAETAATNATAGATSATTSASNALASADAAGASEQLAEDYAASADLAESNAVIAQLAAEGARDTATTKADEASTSATNAASSASAASTSEGNAGSSATLAAQYAVHPRDTLIPTTPDYSAYHWAQEASDSAAAVSGAVQWMGPWDAALNGTPPTPSQPSRYYITSSGTVDGFSVDPDDQIIYDTISGSWIKSDGADAVASVNGYLGTVVLTHTDVGALAAGATAVAADKLATARTITLGGDLTGSAVFDGTVNVTITAAVADDSHNHIIANIDGLQAILDGKLDAAAGVAYDSSRLGNVAAASYARKDADNLFTNKHEFSHTDVLGDWSTNPIQIRERNQVGATQSAWQYAPAMSFHWSGRVARSLALEQDGEFVLRGQSYAGNRDDQAQMAHLHVNDIKAKGWAYANNFVEAGVNLSSKYLGISAKAADSNLLGGFSYSTNNDANTIVRRTNLGDITVRLVRTEFGVQTSAPSASAELIFRNNVTDNYHRSMSSGAYKTWHESVAPKITVSTAAPSGGKDGDIWLQV